MGPLDLSLAAWVLVLVVAGAAVAGEWPRFDDWWDYRDPAATEMRFRELLERAPPDVDYRLQLVTQLARAVGLQGRTEESLALLDSVRAELDESSAETRVRWLLEQGRTLNSSGQRDAARPLFEDAWALGRETGSDGYAIDAGHMIAIVAETRESIEWNERLIALAEGSDDPSAQRWVGSLYNNLGWAYFDAKDYQAALEAHAKGVTFWEEREDPYRWRIARWSVAKQLRFLDRCGEALAINRELEREWRDAGEPDGYVYEELGECLLARGDAAGAAGEFRRAYELLLKDESLVAREPDRLERLKRLGSAN